MGTMLHNSPFWHLYSWYQRVDTVHSFSLHFDDIFGKGWRVMSYRPNLCLFVWKKIINKNKSEQNYSRIALAWTFKNLKPSLVWFELFFHNPFESVSGYKKIPKTWAFHSSIFSKGSVTFRIIFYDESQGKNLCWG